jgi:alanine dehydrogenase
MPTATGQQIAIITKGLLQTQEQLMPIETKKGALFIGIPRETTLQENRVALVPSSVLALTKRGHRVLIETGAGEKSNYTDHEYSEAGAEVAYNVEKVYEADVILKVAPPTLEEIEFCHPHQILITPLQAPIITEEYINKLRQKRVIALAMEYIKDDVGSFPIVRIMSEIAGLNAMLTAAELLSVSRQGIGVLLGGVSGVPPAKVVILGAGVVAEFVTRVALGLGAEVRIFDNNIYKLMRLQNQVGRQLFTSAIDPSVVERELATADAAIGAIHSGSGRAPVVVTEDMVRKMKAGSVIIDVSIDQGGCFETSRVTSHEKPIFKYADVIHYCVPNIASRVPRTASQAISNIMTPILLQSEHSHGLYNLITSKIGLINGIYVFKGSLTNMYLSERFNMRFTSIELLITPSMY